MDFFFEHNLFPSLLVSAKSSVIMDKTTKSNLNITLKSENDQYIIVRNITPEPMKKPKESQHKNSSGASKVSIFTTANSPEDRVVYTQLTTTPYIVR
jgi:hypothetical protein